jgi:hypothetical protein
MQKDPKIVKKSQKMLSINEIFELKPSEFVPTILKQGRATNVQQQMLLRAKRKLFLLARDKFYESITRNVLNNTDYLKNKHNMTFEEFDRYVSKNTVINNISKYDANTIRKGFTRLSDAYEFAFVVGYAFNVDTDILLHQNLEYLDMKGFVSDFKQYAANVEDMKKLNKMT